MNLTTSADHFSTIVSRTIWASGLKRVFDIVVAAPLFLLFSPLLVIAAAMMFLTSPGPVFFLQRRVGRNGNVFRPLKLRTMRAGRRPDPLEVITPDHPDGTPVGRLLRRLKLDEAPQLLNVLSGSMSLVGPRPTLPEQVARYDEFRRRRLLVRPGMTGLAQVNGNTTMSWDERILYDVAYVRCCSFRTDAAVLFRTITVLILGESRTNRPFRSTPYARWVTPPDGYLAPLDESGKNGG